MAAEYIHHHPRSPVRIADWRETHDATRSQDRVDTRSFRNAYRVVRWCCDPTRPGFNGRNRLAASPTPPPRSHRVASTTWANDSLVTGEMTIPSPADEARDRTRDHVANRSNAASAQTTSATGSRRARLPHEPKRWEQFGERLRPVNWRRVSRIHSPLSLSASWWRVHGEMRPFRIAAGSS